MKTKRSLAALSALWMAGLLPLPAQDLTPTERQKVNAMIAEIDTVLLGGSKKNNVRALATCRAALKSTKTTYDFFLEATKEVDFDQAGKRESDWREWKTRNGDRYKSKEYIAALQFQLRFLVLTLGVLGAEDGQAVMEKALPELVSFYDRVAASIEKLDEHRGVLSRSVLESVFAKKLKLNITVQNEGNWPPAALPVSQGYELVILPYLRNQKDARALANAWDKRISQEAKTLDPGSGTGFGRGGGLGRRFGGDQRDREREERREETRQKNVSIEEFTARRLPELQWGQARDALTYGDDAAGSFVALGRVLRENMEHPQALAWLIELKALAKGGTASGIDRSEQ